MSFKLLEAVYNLDKNATTATEQAVLAALAYRANDKTRLCFPKQETIAAMTHLSRSTIQLALNSLREHGFIEWKSGGLTKKRGKYGQALANDYRLNIPQKAEKKDSSGAEKVMHSDRQPDMAMTDSQTRQCPTVGHGHDRQSDTAVTDSRTPTEITTRKTKEISNRNSAGADSDSSINLAIDELLEDMAKIGKTPVQRKEGLSPVRMALRVCGIAPGTPEYNSNIGSFRKVMIKIGAQRALEAVIAFESEVNQGEHKSVRNLAAVLMSRLNQLVPIN